MGKFRLLLLVALAATISACDDDGTRPRTIEGDPIHNLTAREDVLLNIETAYNKRRIEWYNGVLDQNFTFFLSAGDVNNGMPASWDRAEEVLINTRLFDKNYAAIPCQSVFLDLRTEDGLAWIESDSPLNPGETWYTTTVFYDFKFEISPNTYIPLVGVKASFTVRDAGPSGNYSHHWQLVEMHDFGDDSAALASSRATQPGTLGQVKALYR